MLTKRVSLSVLGLMALTTIAGAQGREKIPLKGAPRISVSRVSSGRGTDANLKAAPTVEAFIDRLPEWGKIYPKEEKKDPGKPSPSKTVENGVQYDVTKTDYSITTTPEEIISFQPVNGFWLGGVIQERGIVEGIGSFTEVPIEAVKRPRLKITTDLLIPDNIETVNNPSSSGVQQAVSSLITKAVRAKIKTGSSITYKMTENYTQEQTALALGLDAHYMGGSVKASLESSTSASRRSISATFIEKAFTVKTDFEGRSGAAAFFNDQFTMDDARKLVDRGQVTVNNMPAYLASITYGRMLIFTMTADGSESDIRGAIQASYDAVAYGAKVSAKYSNLLKSGSTTITVTSVGGPAEATSGLIKSGKLSDFFDKSAPLTSMVPISYTVNTLRENRLASMARTTTYTATTYNANNTVFNYKITMYWKIVDPDDGIADNTVECFGELRLNGERRWSISRDAADRHKKEAGETIDILEGGGETGSGMAFMRKSDSLKPTIYQLSGFLKDADGLSKDDTLLSFSNFPLKLEELAGKGARTYGYKDIMDAIMKASGIKPHPIPIGQGAARLVIRVDKVAS